MLNSQTQSNISMTTIIFLGTASFLVNENLTNIYTLLPTQSYDYQYTEKRDHISYSLKHEVMIQIENADSEDDRLIDIPVVRKIKAKFGKPTPLDFFA